MYNDGATSDVPVRSRVFWFETHQLLPRPEAEHSESSPVSKPVLDLLPSPRLLFSHIPYHAIPKCKDGVINCKYIYVARNPKDVAVSLYKFLMALETEPGMTWDIFLKVFLEGKREYCTNFTLGYFQ